VGDFTHPSRPALRPNQPPLKWVPVLSRGEPTGASRSPPTPT